MTEASATALVRLLALGAAAGVLVRWLLRDRGPRVTARSRLQYAAYVFWLAELAIIAHVGGVAPTPPPYDALVRPLGLLLAVGGGALAAWAALHLGRYWDIEISARPDHRVVDDGPFGIVRHPIYVGLLGFLLGCTLALADVVALIGTLASALVVRARVRAEERFLLERLGEEYRDYMRRVPGLVPRR